MAKSANIPNYHFDEHCPVMLAEMIENMNIKDGGVYLDCTFGAGGYSRAILESKDCVVIALDPDPSVRKYAEKLYKDFPDNFIFIQGNFARAAKLLEGNADILVNKHLQEKKYNGFDGIVLDLGVSSMQLDQRERGFSFQEDGNLDMRMSMEGFSAADFINNALEEEIANVIYQYGDEHESRRIAKAIVNYREAKSIDTTLELANIIRDSKRKKIGKINPSTKSFQAIRIHINQELDSLKDFLRDSNRLLADNGRLVAVSFHSLEDSIVKAFFRSSSEKKVARSKYATPSARQEGKWLKLISTKVIAPTYEEIKKNIRSRSAKMRVAEKLPSSQENQGDIK